MFSGNIAKTQEYYLSPMKMVFMGKEIFSFGLASLVLSFVCIFTDSNITKNTFFFFVGSNVGLVRLLYPIKLSQHKRLRIIK